MKVKPMLCQDADFDILDVISKSLGKFYRGELKHDGVRALVDVHNYDMNIYGRSGNEIINIFELLGLKDENEDFLLDGEITVMVDGKESLPEALSRTKCKNYSRSSIMRWRNPITYWVFDILRWNGMDLKDEPYIMRKMILRGLLEKHFFWQNIKYVPEYIDIEKLWEITCEFDHEGIVIKKIDQPYLENQKEWYRLKVSGETEVLVVGFLEANGARLGFKSLVMEENEEYVGKCGQGFSNSDLGKISCLLDISSGDGIMQLPDGELAYHIKKPFKMKIKHYGKMKGLYRNAVFRGLIN